VRRAEAIKKHLSAMICEPLELQRLFNQWLGPSEDLRQYLWAHRNAQIRVARQLIDILASVALVEMLQYLIEDFWGRRAGWPDLLVYRDNEFFFAEVKFLDDKLGKSQERWIRGDRERLRFPFKLVEVLRKLDYDAIAGRGSRKSAGLVNAVAAGTEMAGICRRENELVDHGRS
jgi:VRR-NUC domain